MPRYTPSEEDRGIVMMMAGAGCSHDLIPYAIKDCYGKPSVDFGGYWQRHIRQDAPHV
jgi:hypothetical protein